MQSHSLVVRSGPKRAYKLKEAAAVLGCGVLTLRRLIKRGDLKSVKWMRHIIIPAEEIDRLLQPKK